MTREKAAVLCPTLTFALALIPLHVNSNPSKIRVPAGYAKIQDTMNNASPGDQVQVSSETPYENLFISKTLHLVELKPQ
jgi:hypothetical protein